MNNSELQSYLISNNLRDVPDWELIKNTYNAETIEVAGQTVYIFNLSFDMAYTPIEDNIVIFQSVPSSVVPLHIHQYIELIYVYQGKCTVVMQNGEINMHEGGVIIIDKQTPHTLKGISNSDIVIDIKLKHDYLNSGFLSRFTQKSTISQLLIDSLIDSRRANNYLHFPLENGSKIVEIMQNIMCEYFDRDFCSTDMIDSYLFIFFTELIRNSNTKTSIEAGNISQKDSIVIDFLRYIEKNHRDCTLTKMAAHYKYHPNYISAMLKRATGKSFKELLQIERLNKAVIYLSNSELPIPDIAEEVGYSSVSFFFKKFKEVYSQTPNKFRENKH
ncbi:AraC family transcriptional regulator [Paenibacillus sp. FSL H8-0261]|uniref:AraC family transcriptional regulator n=1 Tax=Paenibacillus sp. FSL H8-0261 TaxID=2921381 RepID=UPI00324D3BA5